LCAAYTRACQPAIRAQLDARRLRMIDLLAAVRVRVVEGPELAVFGDSDRLLANVNTPDEYEGIDAGPDHEL
jgi:molybdopterin-guanine dinucleotide biosynthesis protein A